MRQWFVLIQKESLEMWRNYKWLWVPLVFILLGVMQPLTTYYLPQIIESMGGFPEGAVFDIPLPTSEQVIVETFSQFGTVGVLILVLTTMGIVANERQSGVINLIIVKPVSHLTYILAKWTGAIALTCVSFILGVCSAAYYTVSLFGELNISLLIQSSLTYGLWLIFVISVTLFFSTFMRGSGAIAFISLLTAIILTLITSVFDWLMSWSPATLTGHAGSLLMTGAAGSGYGMALSLTIIIIAGLLAGATYIFRNLQPVE